MSDHTVNVHAGKKDVLWNYVGTFMSMASNFLLIPLLLVFLSSEEIGLWYVFVAIAGFAQLLEFGFTSTLARNLLFCLSGVRKLSKQGRDINEISGEVDWHLTRVVVRTSKAIYAVMGVVALIASASLGTVYVDAVTHHFSVAWSFPSWILFIASIFTNLYFLYCLTNLRGVGDIAGENKAKTFGRLAQLLITALLLMAGFGLMAASIGFLAYSTIMRFVANRIFKSHKDVQRGLSSDASPIRRAEMKEVLGTVSFVAWRDGVVSLAWYGATQAMSLLCSAFLGLAETATYSVMLQFATAAHNFSSVYMHTYLPSFQSAYVKGDRQRQRDSIDRGMSCYLLMFLICTLGVTLVVLPILPLFKSDFICNPTLYLGLSVYCFLLNQHSLYCQFIVSMNEIPYFKAYLASTVAGVMLTCLLCGWMHWGAWGLILGQAIPQLCYNNWHWPQYVYKKIGGTYIQSISTGTRWFVKNITEVCKRRH